MSLFHELKRRNVIRVATGYIVVAWLIIQVAETLFPIFEFPASAIRVVVIALGIGFVPAIIVAWVFQITPDGVKLDKDAIAGEVTTSGRNLDRAIIITLLLGISFFAFDKFVLAPDRAAEREAVVAEAARSEAIVGFYGDRSIAVIPFDNMSSDPEQEYFVDGVAEEVLNLLARIRELRVISRSSAFAFKGQNLDIGEIAERLDVAHILEGSVRKAGNTVRVTAQLIEARTDTHIWSKTYERELSDVFAIQDEIAADVAKNLRIELLRPLPRSRPTDPLVRALTQQAKQLAEIRPENLGVKMEGLLQEALKLDPEYVPAYRWMSMAQYFLARDGVITWDEQQARGEVVFDRIAELDPNDGYVDAIRAYRLSEDGQYEEAATLYTRSLQKNVADSNTLRIAGVYAAFIGKFDVALRLLRHAVAIDPLCYQCLYRWSEVYFLAGDFSRAAEIRERYLTIGSGGGYNYGIMLLMQGNAAEALAQYEAMMPSAQSYAGQAMALQTLGRHEDAAAALEVLREHSDSDVPSLLVDVAAWGNDSEEMFGRLEKAATDQAGFLIEKVFSPLYARYADNPRWNAWRASVGMSVERLDAIEFNPDLPE